MRFKKLIPAVAPPLVVTLLGVALYWAFDAEGSELPNLSATFLWSGAHAGDASASGERQHAMRDLAERVRHVASTSVDDERHVIDIHGVCYDCSDHEPLRDAFRDIAPVQHVSIRYLVSEEVQKPSAVEFVQALVGLTERVGGRIECRTFSPRAPGLALLSQFAIYDSEHPANSFFSTVAYAWNGAPVRISGGPPPGTQPTQFDHAWQQARPQSCTQMLREHGLIHTLASR